MKSEVRTELDRLKAAMTTAVSDIVRDPDARALLLDRVRVETLISDIDFLKLDMRTQNNGESLKLASAVQYFLMACASDRKGLSSAALRCLQQAAYELGEAVGATSVKRTGSVRSNNKAHAENHAVKDVLMAFWIANIRDAKPRITVDAAAAMLVAQAPIKFLTARRYVEQWRSEAKQVAKTRGNWHAHRSLHPDLAHLFPDS